MPEHTELAFAELAVAILLNGFVHAKILVVASHNLHRLAVAMVKEYEVFYQVQEITLVHNAFEHCRQLNVSRIALFQAFPLVEEVPLGVYCSHSCVIAIAKDKEGIIPKQLWYSVEIIGIVVVESVFNIYVVVFQFHEDERQTVYKAYKVGASVIQLPIDPKFTYSKKLVVVGIIKVDNLRPHFLRSAVGFYAGHRNTITNKSVFLLVDLHQALRCQMTRHGIASLSKLFLVYPGVEFPQSFAEAAAQEYFVIAVSSECSRLSKHLIVEGIDACPSEFLLEIVSRSFLYQPVL